MTSALDRFNGHTNTRGAQGECALEILEGITRRLESSILKCLDNQFHRKFPVFDQLHDILDEFKLDVASSLKARFQLIAQARNSPAAPVLISGKSRRARRATESRLCRTGQRDEQGSCCGCEQYGKTRISHVSSPAEGGVDQDRSL